MSDETTTPVAKEKEAKTPENKPTTPAKKGYRGGRNERDQKSRGRGRGRGQKREEKEFEEELLQIDRVTRVVKGGRRLRFRATVVIGDRKGRVGFGVDKAVEVPQAIQKAVRNAKKNLITVPMKNGTIPHEVHLKFKSAKVLIMPAKSGTGIIAGGAMRKIADLAGIENLLGKNIGTSNKIASGKAMIMALTELTKKVPATSNKQGVKKTSPKTNQQGTVAKKEKAAV